MKEGRANDVDINEVAKMQKKMLTKRKSRKGTN